MVNSNFVDEPKFLKMEPSHAVVGRVECDAAEPSIEILLDLVECVGP